MGGDAVPEGGGVRFRQFCSSSLCFGPRQTQVRVLFEAAHGTVVWVKPQQFPSSLAMYGSGTFSAPVHWEQLFLNIYHEKLLLPRSIILSILTEFCSSLNHVMAAKAAAACLACYSSTNNAHLM